MRKAKGKGSQPPEVPPVHPTAIYTDTQERTWSGVKPPVRTAGRLSKRPTPAKQTAKGSWPSGPQQSSHGQALPRADRRHRQSSPQHPSRPRPYNSARVETRSAGQ